MTPGKPGQAVSVGAETRRRIEVVSRDENPRRSSPGKVDSDEGRDRLACAGMILPDTDHARAAAVDNSIRVAQRVRGACGNGRNRAWRPACLLAIEPLIAIVGKVDHPVADGERAASIFVRARANAESAGVFRGYAFPLPVRAGAVDESPSLHLRLGLAPVDRLAVERDLLETDRVGDNEVGSDGGCPEAIGADGHAIRSRVGVLSENRTRPVAPQARRGGAAWALNSFSGTARRPETC